MLSETASRKIKQEYLYEVLEAKDVHASTALFAYASFLNQHPHRFDYFPLYLKVLETNNQYAVDAMLEGLEPETFFDMVVVPNHFIAKKIFELLGKHNSNSLYEKTRRVLCGYIRRIYKIVEDGFRIYPLNLNDLNNFAKLLDENEDQNYPANRVILDTLQCLGELDNLNEKDKQKLRVGRQANRIRGDFLDDTRNLSQAITEAVLKKSDEVDLGVLPSQLQ